MAVSKFKPGRCLRPEKKNKGNENRAIRAYFHESWGRGGEKK